MRTVEIAFRNLFRNVRRSATTILAVATGAMAILLFGGFVANIFHGLETNVVRNFGHLQVFRRGYFLFGAGDPASFGIADYKQVMAAIDSDPVMASLDEVVTPQLTLFGVAGNFKEGVSRTFLGIGLVPSDRIHMMKWDRYGLHFPSTLSGMADSQGDSGVVGVGLARVLHLCGPLKVKDCPAPPKPPQPAGPVDADIAALAASVAATQVDSGKAGGPPRVDLLAATAHGAPNVVSLKVVKALRQGNKETDDVFVGMPLGLAQTLIYGRGAPQVTSVVVQLKDTATLGAAKRRLEGIFRRHGWDLEIRSFHDLMPFYDQVIGMFRMIFAFVAVLMGAIVLFTVVNTMSMAVMERTAEIGTLRALGLRRAAVRRLFLVEGALLGATGATIGVAAALVLAWSLNHSGLTWLPPSSVIRIPLTVDVFANPGLMAGVWVGLAALATLSALLPANRAARLPVVDALHHV